MAKPEYRDPEDEITFNIIDEKTVERLRREGDITLPYKNLDKLKDERWNTKQMSSKLLQGILNGDSVPSMARSLLEVVGNNVASAMRNARTMVTGAENVGRLDSYKELDSKGVVQKKVWIATADDRTRESHLELDGEEVDIDKVFSNELMYPGDPTGDPSEVYNCRCSMRDHIIGFRRADGSISYVNTDRDPTSHTEAIQEEKERRDAMMPQQEVTPAEEPASEPEEKERIESEIIKNAMSADDYQAFMDLVNGADNSELFREYGDEIDHLTRTKNGGQFTEATNSIEFSYETNTDGMSRYSTIAHEYNHSFDYRIGKNENLHFTEIDAINDRCYTGYGKLPCREWASSSDEFLGALRQDMEALNDRGIPEVIAELRTTRTWYNATSGVQDALDGFYGTQATYHGWGHGNAYYNRMYTLYIKSWGKANDLKEVYNELGFRVTSQAAAQRQFRQYRAAAEAWANIGSAVTCGGPELDAIKQYMPNTLNAYMSIIKEA